MLEVHNPQRRPKLLLQLHDEIPPRLGTPPQRVIESLPGGETLRWIINIPPRNGEFTIGIR